MEEENAKNSAEDDPIDSVNNYLELMLVKLTGIPPYLPPLPDSPYIVIEDLKLLHEINIYLRLINNNIEDAILSVCDQNILNRTKESMRERYELLKLLTLQDLQQIYPFIRHLDTDSPAVLKLQRKNGSDELHIEVSFPKSQEESQTKQKNHKSEHQSSKKKSGEDCEICQNFEKTMRLLQNPRVLPENAQHNQANEDSNPPENFEIKRNFDNNVRKVLKPLDSKLLALKEAMLQLMEKYQMSPPEILTICESLTGEIKEVDEYLSADAQRKKELIWDPVDDEVLEKAKGREDYRFKILLKYKGAERMRKRAEFKGIHLPFEF